MSEEIQEAAQIIRVGFEGIEIAMKVGSGGLELMKKAVSLLAGMFFYEKSMGKTSMKKLLLKGGDLQVLQFKSEDLKKVKKLAKKYGVLYSVLPDINKKDGMSEVIFHTEAVPRVNMILKKLSTGRIATFEDYVKNGDEKELDKLLDFLKRQQGNEKALSGDGAKTNQRIDELIEKVGIYATEKKSISVKQVKETFQLSDAQAETVVSKLQTMGVLDKRGRDGSHRVMLDQADFLKRVKGYQDLVDRMRIIAASKDTSLSELTIRRNLMVEENDHAVKLRIPGTEGEHERYLWLNKENIMEVQNAKTILTFINPEKDYKIYDKENRVVEAKRGAELNKNYNQVEEQIRERSRKSQKTAQKRNKQKKQKAKKR